MSATSTWRRQVAELVHEFGATFEVTTGHIKIRHPSGWSLTASSSPSDCSRAIKNLRADLRRKAAGVWR
ncbi:MAG TPA: hypothetical protein VFD36_29555 [Kofleriaceae bacterium]|nr:hypothetical protein [Kofleriaceae bacterium]